MKLKLITTALACLGPLASFAGQIEYDFNEMFIGDTRTRNSATSPNNGNLNTGSGFLPDNGSASGGAGEFNNSTGVLQFLPADLAVPAGVTNFVSDQGPDVNSGAGVVFSTSNGTTFRRMQERAFATPLGTATDAEVWFSYLFTLKGPDSEMIVAFNTPSTVASGAPANISDFSIATGSSVAPGAVALINVSALTADSAFGTNRLYYDDLNGNGSIDGSEIDLNNDGIINGVSFNDGLPHLIIGKVTVDAGGGADDIFEIWLDPADALALGTPTISHTENLVDTTDGIFSVMFEGVRNAPAVDIGGFSMPPYVAGGRADIDHFRASDLVDAQEYVTGNLLPDPLLRVDANSASIFNFGATYGSGVTINATPITITLVNDGASQDIDITDVAFANGNPTGVFGLSTVPPVPVTLSPGQTIAITVTAGSDVYNTTFTETIDVITNNPQPLNSQDKALNVSAEFFTDGVRVNVNSSFDTNTAGWENDHFIGPVNTPARVLPGFNGSNAMVRIKGVGDPSINGAPNNFSQAVPNGAEDFEFIFFMSPHSLAQFESNLGFSPFGGERAFQLAIQADQEYPTQADGTEGLFTDTINADNVLISLAYMPFGDGVDETDEDFYVFNGTDWIATGLGALIGSVDKLPAPAVLVDSDLDGLDDNWEDNFLGDNSGTIEPSDLTISNGASSNNDSDLLNDLEEFLYGTEPLLDDTDGDGLLDHVDLPGDGILNPADQDTVNWVLVRIKGTGFGTSSASYSISVSPDNSTGVGTSTGSLTAFHSADATTNTVGSYTFLSGDTSTGSGYGGFGSECTSYWIDEVSYFSGFVRDPSVSVSANTLVLSNHNGTPIPGQITVTNTGFSQPLNLSALPLLDGTNFAVTDPSTLPVVLNPGESTNLTINHTGSGINSDSLTVTTDDILTPMVNVDLVGSSTNDSNLLANWDWEVPGTDNVTDTDTFAIWQENGRSSDLVDIPGFIAGSNTAADFVANGVQASNSFGVPAASFLIDIPFKTNGTVGDRMFSLLLRGTGNGTENINLRITPTSLVQAFNGAWTTVPNLDLSGAPLTLGQLYWFRLIGNDWGGGSPTFSIELFDSDGVTSLGASGATNTLFRAEEVLPMSQMTFRADFGGARFSVDDITAMLVLPAPNVKIVSFSGGPGAFTIIYDAGGANVNIERSVNGTTWNDIATGENSGTFTDNATPPDPTVLYRVYTP